MEFEKKMHWCAVCIASEVDKNEYELGRFGVGSDMYQFTRAVNGVELIATRNSSILYS